MLNFILFLELDKSRSGIDCFFILSVSFTEITILLWGITTNWG